MERMCAQNIACKDDSFTYMKKMWPERKVGRKKKTSHLLFLQQHTDTPLKKTDIHTKPRPPKVSWEQHEDLVILLQQNYIFSKEPELKLCSLDNLL